MTKYSTITAIFCAIFLQMLPVTHAYAAEQWKWNCQNERLTSFWEKDIGGNELSGNGTICATPFGLWSTLSVRGLMRGNSYTTWWVYIDDADACVNFPLTPENSEVPFAEPVGYAGGCGLADFFTESESEGILDPLAVFGRMDSVIAKRRYKTRFAGDLRNFVPSPGSQIWMFVFGHGPADTTDRRQLARQLLTPEDPSSGAPHLGIAGRPFGYPAGVVVIQIP